ncbi:MAG: hypothetical protein JWP25_7584 [Bradyrhizobium sp.]|nr:hypothetical protein [Bradyrhizobium sp.]
MKRFITALSCAAILAVTLSAAEARPHRHHQHHHHARVEAAPQQEQSFFGGFQSGFSTGSGVVERARQYIGATAHEVGVRSTLWCSAFLRKITGASGVDDRALSWERHQHIAPQVGAVVTMGRRGGGHVGVVSGFDNSGNPIVISGNGGGRRVTERVYPRHRIRAWVSPT